MYPFLIIKELQKRYNAFYAINKDEKRKTSSISKDAVKQVYILLWY